MERKNRPQWVGWKVAVPMREAVIAGEIVLLSSWGAALESQLGIVLNLLGAGHHPLSPATL